MHKELVATRKWIDEPRFLHALNYCMLLPGPEAQQLATYIGWLMHGAPGGLIAGALFIVPGFIAILLLSVLYATLHNLGPVSAVLLGLKAAVLAIVVEAILRIGKRALKNEVMVSIAAIAFVAIFFFRVPFPLIVLGAGLFGLVGHRFVPAEFASSPTSTRTSPETHKTVIDLLEAQGELAHTQPSRRRAALVFMVGLALWFFPLAGLGLAFGSKSIFFQEGMFFSKCAVVTFGGAYAALAYVAQRAVETFGWLRPGEMVDGLGLAETTPGPLIMVVQFVAFIGAFRNPGIVESPLVAGVLGSVVTVWVTFVPCFLWIFLGAPFIEMLRGNRAIHAALSSITAAVVGVVLNLSVWFAMHTLFAEVREQHFGALTLQTPLWDTIHLPALGLSLVAMVSMFYFKLGMVRTLACCAILGVALGVLSR